MDPVQILLFFVVSILTGLLVFVGVQVILILRSLGRTLEKLNQVLDDLSLVSGTVTRPILGLTNLVQGMKELKNLLDVLSERLHTPKMQKPIQDMPPVLSQEPTVSAEMTQMSVTQTYPHISSIQERGRRFFHKDGRPLMS